MNGISKDADRAWPPISSQISGNRDKEEHHGISEGLHRVGNLSQAQMQVQHLLSCTGVFNNQVYMLKDICTRIVFGGYASHGSLDGPAQLRILYDILFQEA